jgi:non-heme chloroperoxidase
LAQASYQSPSIARDRFFISSDHVQLHYLEAGRGQTLVFVPGWTMPAWIFDRQIADLSRRYHVVAFDPRGQGDSTITAGGSSPTELSISTSPAISASPWLCT